MFLISAQKHRLWLLVRTASPIYVLSRKMKNIRAFYLKRIRFCEVKFSVYLNRSVFVKGVFILSAKHHSKTHVIINTVMKQSKGRSGDLKPEHKKTTNRTTMGPTTIMKTCLYTVDPLKPHFYIVKLGFAGAYIIFLFLLKNIDCRYSLEPPRRGGSNEYLCLEQNYEKHQNFYLKIFNFWW